MGTEKLSPGIAQLIKVINYEEEKSNKNNSKCNSLINQS
jgi:hypothetical protein